MESEKIKVVDENRNPNGIATREEVHNHGYWHETFHCWIVSPEEGTDYILFQMRSPNKRDFPNLLDITAAGHILAHETVEDGIREVHEELGIPVTFEELVPLGILKNRIIHNGFIDKEFCHTYLFRKNIDFDDFNPQEEEVSGIFKADLGAFCDFCLDIQRELDIEGFHSNKARNRDWIKRTITKDDFVPHEDNYFKNVARMIQKNT